MSETIKPVGIQSRITVDGHDYMLVSEHYAKLNEVAVATKATPLVEQVALEAAEKCYEVMQAGAYQPVCQKAGLVTIAIEKATPIEWQTGFDTGYKAGINKAAQPQRSERETLLRQLLQEMIDCYVSINDLPEEFASKVKDTIKESEQLLASGAASGTSTACSPDRVAGSEPQELEKRISDYLSSGGLFNPEMMEHDKVRKLIIDCRDALTAERQKREQAERVAQVCYDLHNALGVKWGDDPYAVSQCLRPRNRHYVKGFC